MNSSLNYKTVTIKVTTVLGENEDMDKSFFEYLDEYSITHKICGRVNEQEEWPVVEYTGGPISLKSMLKERFGMEQNEILDLYPELNPQNEL